MSGTATSGARSPARIPSLDGLRAISIVLVLAGHLVRTRGFPAPNALALVGDVANLGVRVFFVISGFLITRLLLEERAATGTISLGGFYVRRFFRIFPAFYTYVAVMVALAAAGVIALAPWDTAAALTYTVNYHHERSWWLGHIWSLSVEEQFYLAWPALLLACGRRAAPWIAAAVLALAPVARVVSIVVPSLRPGLGETFPTVADAIAAGCLLACVREELWARPRVRAALSSPLFVLVPIAVVVANRLPLRFSLTVGETLMNVAIAACIERVVRLSDGPVGRALNARPIAFIGTLSYSIYLWQQPFLEHESGAWPTRFPLNLALAFAAALTSYFLVEKPMLELRARLARRRRQARAAAKAA